LVRGVEPGLVDHARTVLGESAVDEALSWCEAQGLVAHRDLRWMPTDRGWLLGNILYGRMWDLAS
ncbi:MAG: coproporphyrinogen III oxidase family protein, partial [Atopobiaceae bacterium]|nr:coproporphyrinogen III oxidase family protein [Atopobiaceae bacterium]